MCKVIVALFEIVKDWKQICINRELVKSIMVYPQGGVAV